MTDAPSSSPRPPRRWGLILSLCLNVFLIAVVAAGIGAAYVRSANNTGGGLAPREMLAMLDGKSRETVETYLRGRVREGRAAQRDVRAARAAVFAAFQAEPFDKEALEGEMAKLRDAETALNALTQRIIADVAAMMTPAERATVARNVRQNFVRRMLGRDPGVRDEDMSGAAGDAGR